VSIPVPYTEIDLTHRALSVEHLMMPGFHLQMESLPQP
jgi:hypothetical protein